MKLIADIPGEFARRAGSNPAPMTAAFAAEPSWGSPIGKRHGVSFESEVIAEDLVKGAFRLSIDSAQFSTDLGSNPSPVAVLVGPGQPVELGVAQGQSMWALDLKRGLQTP